jgi:ribonuclease HII
MPSFAIERKAQGPVAGIDEVGRGPLAGPVYAAAVILNPRKLPKGVNDSKAMSEARREALFDDIMQKALAIGIGMATVEEIDSINILQATMLAMTRGLDHRQGDAGSRHVRARPSASGL